MTADTPSAEELAAATEAELRALAAVAPRDLRMRLLVAAHSVGLLVRELAARPSVHTSDSGHLTTAILDGVHDRRLTEVAGSLRDDVRGRLAISTPGYDRLRSGSPVAVTETSRPIDDPGP